MDYIYTHSGDYSWFVKKRSTSFVTKQASFLSTYNNSAVSSSSDTFWHQLARDWWTRPEEFALGRAPSASRKLTHGKS